MMQSGGELVIARVELSEPLEAWQYHPSKGAWPAWLIPYVAFVHRNGSVVDHERDPQFFRFGYDPVHHMRGCGGEQINPDDWFVRTGTIVLQPIEKYGPGAFDIRFKVK